MPKKINLIGQRFCRLVVVSEADPIYIGKQRQVMWNCLCDCGNKVVVSSGRLRSGNTKSCGCYMRDKISRMRRRDLTGMTFGRLTVISENGAAKNGHRMWLCQCSCGNTTTVNGSNLTSGGVVSCGCFKVDANKNRLTTHGESHTRLYGIWSGMKDRCYNPNNISFETYGKIGVHVCDEWLHSYESFRDWAIEHGYDKTAERGECTLDRINPYGNYSPDNCRWADMFVQNHNKRKDYHND